MAGALLALRSSPPVLSAAEGERIARENYGLAVTLTVLPGERDCNFHARTADDRQFVLKILDVAADAQSIECLSSVLAFLAEQDRSLPVQRPYPTLSGEAIGHFARDGLAYATCLLEFLPGRLLAGSHPGPLLIRNVGQTLARIDRALQGFFHPALARRLAWDVRHLPELSQFSPLVQSQATRARVEQVSEALRNRLGELRSLRSQAIHGDCHGSNLLVGADLGGVVGILDFGDMIHAPRIFEPAVAMSELLTENVVPLDAVAEVLRGYAQGQRLEPLEVELLFEIITARHAATVLLHAWRSEHDIPGARVLAESAVHAARSLEELHAVDRAALSRSWHAAAGTARLEAVAEPEQLLARRHRLLGAGAELFYERPLHLVRGAGVWLYDAAGQAYLDVYNNVPHVGHTHPTVVAAIQRQTAVLATHTRYLHERVLQYAEQLTARTPPHLDACIFVNSGSEANDVAWRIAKFMTGHEGALVMANAYHGITDAVAALTPGIGQPQDPRVVTIAPPSPGLRADDTLSSADRLAATRDADEAIATLADRGVSPAAFFIDTAVTSSGIFDPPPDWAAAVTSCAARAGALIVADEVQYGLGRSGTHFWGFERRGLRPDLVTLGKPVGNGYPMGVVIANRAVVEAFQAKFGFFSTFGGNAVAAAAGRAVLQVLDEEGLQGNAEAVGAYVRAQLESVAARHSCLGAVRGAGLLLGLDIHGNDAVRAKRNTQIIVNLLASKYRVLIGSEGPNGSILKLRPPMPFRREHADLLVQAIDAAAATVDST